MEALAVTGMVFGLMGGAMGIFAYVRLERLTKALTDKGVLDEDDQLD